MHTYSRLSNKMATSKPIILITGANQGLGYYTAQQLASTGSYHVLIGSRSTEKAHAAIDQLLKDPAYAIDKENLGILQIDVADDNSISTAAAEVQKRFGKLDMLLNNAGISGNQAATPEQTLREAYQEQFNTNVFGAAAVTEAFLPLLRKGGSKRLAFVSTGLSSLQKAADGTQPMSKFPLYRTTKAALNMVMLYYAHKLENEGFVVSAPAPGFCATNLNGGAGKKDPRDGAKMLVKALLGDREEVHACVVSESGREPW
jgi:NAD(P)-dependent dehydrogenase (short-subunit alcohol dehydrogenase family)